MKVDVLLVIAHPDDDVMVGGWLAHWTLDEHKRVAVVYTTNGDGGGNAIAAESGQALGKVREIEARRALAVVGIDEVWFLGGNDTPGQNPLRSLERWNHGKMLNDLVRLMRVTRPDLVLTWLPAQVAGENHGDHQAAGVLAVEAFDLSGDRLAFPEQVSMPRVLNGYANLLEGMEPWLPKKLYFFTDAFEVFTAYWHDTASRSPFRAALDTKTGPVFDPKAVSPSRSMSYAELLAQQEAEYATQDGAIGAIALRTHDFSPYAYSQPLIYGKSLVGGAVTGDIFEGISEKAIPFHRAEVPPTPRAAGITLQVGDPWSFYTAFWRAHGIERIAALLPVPELGAGAGEQLHIPLVACNYTERAADVDVTAEFPADWDITAPAAHMHVAPGGCMTNFQSFVTPGLKQSAWHEVRWRATAGTEMLGEAKLRLYVGKSGGLPQ